MHLATLMHTFILLGFQGGEICQGERDYVKGGGCPPFAPHK